MVDDRTYRDLTHGIYPPRKETPVLELDEARVALPQDEPIFRRLCERFLEERYREGDLVLPCRENVEYYLRYFRYYALNGWAGHTLLVGDYAMVMHGEIPDALKLEPGKLAWLWCIYIEPEYRSKGITHKFHRLGMARLLERGFKLTMAQTKVDNEPVFRVTRGTVEGKEGAGDSRSYMLTFWWPLGEGGQQET